MLLINESIKCNILISMVFKIGLFLTVEKDVVYNDCSLIRQKTGWFGLNGLSSSSDDTHFLEKSNKSLRINNL